MDIEIEKQAEKLLILPIVLERVTMSRSGWLQGVKDGRYPAPVRLSPRRVAWRESDITAFINGLQIKRQDRIGGHIAQALLAASGHK